MQESKGEGRKKVLNQKILTKVNEDNITGATGSGKDQLSERSPLAGGWGEERQRWREKCTPT